MIYFFDFDGTLVDSMQYVRGSENNYLMRRNYFLDDDTWRYVVAIGYYNSAKHLIEKFNINQTIEDAVKEIQSDLAYEYANNVDFKPYAKDYVKKLKSEGHKVYIVSASPLNFIIPCVKNHEMQDYFDGIISVDEFAPYAKTEVKFFELVLEKLGVDAKNVIYVEDSLLPILTAKKTGMTVYGVKDLQASEDFEEIVKNANKVIYDYKDLL